ncbi:MAG: 2Fe-2S iron-sulfur cluster-binding protein [Acidimicrobiales bacterium]
MALSEPVTNAPGVPHDRGFHLLRVGRIVPETSQASSFVLDIPPALGAAFAYEAGQFCTFRVWVDGQPHVRCYSMSSSPVTDAELRVTVKRVPGGVVSNWMHDHLAPGDVVEVSRPAGFFQLVAGEGDIVAFSAGSGITPVLSLLKTAVATTSRPVRLLYANPDREAIILRSEIDALGSHHGERCAVSHHLDVEQGFVGPDAVRSFVETSTDPEFYVCGPGPFMDVVERTLLTNGVDPTRIHIEHFTPAERLPEPAPPAAPHTTSRVTIDLGGRSDTTDHHPGTTILQTARQMGMSPPFSCESGSCATCMAKLVEGTARMHVNNALTDDEVADGWVLTCQAVPTSPSLHVAYDYEEG